MNPTQIENLKQTAISLYQTSVGIYWSALPVVFILAIGLMYVTGEISGSRVEQIFRRLLISILLLAAFPKISELFRSIDTNLVQALGGELPLNEIFSHFGDKAKAIKDGGSFNWLRIGQLGLNIISTLSFLVLAVVKSFLDVLHLSLWNLAHILAPIAFMGLMFQSFSQVTRGIFMGLLELSLWKPFWVILARILLALGFGELPQDPAEWFNTAVMNFAVAGLMACTPLMVHGFLSGSLISLGGTAIQTMLAGAGIALARAPMQTIRTVASGGADLAARVPTHLARSLMRPPSHRGPNVPGPNGNKTKH